MVAERKNSIIMELKPLSGGTQEEASTEEGRNKQTDGWTEKTVSMNRGSQGPLGEHKRDHEAAVGNTWCAQVSAGKKITMTRQEARSEACAERKDSYRNVAVNFNGT